MQQLTQKLGSGDMIIQEVPYPQIGKGMVIVKNHYSIISAGTEGSTVVAARKSLIGKAKERPQQVKQVLDTLKKQGPIQTYRAVMKKLDAYSPLGYSCAGEVIEVGEGFTEFKLGDKVACAGVGYANHAEIISVPVNLCVKLDNNANLKDAAYNTLGAISMQGVRQADMRLGESCVVIGLGLLGQLAALILKASGVTVIGIDVSEAAVKKAFPGASIIRPSVVFGPEDQFFNRFAGMAQLSPVLPVFGCPTFPKITLFGENGALDFDFYGDGEFSPS
jgi:polar amino acid transport system substrate-binding protein